jgi:hypothetical protein
MFTVEKGLKESIKQTKDYVSEEMKKGVEHFQKFEQAVGETSRAIKYAHTRIDTRAIAIKAAEKRIVSLEERCDVLTGQVSILVSTQL